MAERNVKIRTLEDFLKVPSDDLRKCLNAFREKIEKIKMARVDAEKSALKVRVPFDVFQWSPHNSENPSANRLRPDTPLNELGIRPSAVSHLREMKIYCLEDCAEASKNELLRTPDIGATTVARIREYLNAIGLDFRENPHPIGAAHERARLFRVQPVLERRHLIKDDSEVAILGLSTTALNACFKEKVLTVGDLRVRTVSSYYSFGDSTRMEIAKALRAAGLNLVSEPTDLELWRGGMLSRDELVFPNANDSVLNLRPWLGAVVASLHAAGILTVGQLSHAVKNGSLRVRGIGKSTAERISDFFRSRATPVTTQGTIHTISQAH